MNAITNEKGVLFELDESTSLYAVSKGLADVRVLIATEPNGSKTRLIVVNGEAVHENKNLEAICVKLDIMALDRNVK